MVIVGCRDPYELWGMGMAAPAPGVCSAKTKEEKPCLGKTQGGAAWCHQHWPDEVPRVKPNFVVTKSAGIQVLYEGEYIPLSEAVVILQTQSPIPEGYVVHRISQSDGDFPDNLQLVSKEVRDAAVKDKLPDGTPIPVKSGKYFPTSVRLHPEILQAIDREAERLGWSRNKVLEHYILQGLRGERPLTLTDQLATR